MDIAQSLRFELWCQCCCSRAYDESGNHSKRCVTEEVKAPCGMTPGKLKETGRGQGPSNSCKGTSSKTYLFSTTASSATESLQYIVQRGRTICQQSGRSDSLSPHLPLTFSLAQQMRTLSTSSGKTRDVLCLPVSSSTA